MPIQYTKDKTKRLSFRVNDTLYDWVAKRSNALGVSPCDFARSLLFQNMAAEEMLRSVETPSRPVADNAKYALSDELLKPAVAGIARSRHENKQKHK